MSTRKHSPRTRGFRPDTDALETRQLLSSVVSGIDAQGDAWTLRLIGPGQVSVVKQNDSSGNPTALTAATDIDTITIGGTAPLTSKLVGVITKHGANSDGRIYFQNLRQLPGRSEQFGAAGYGILAIDMPDFWLGNTTPSVVSTTPSPASILLPDGVDTLRFGGVDTTFNRPAASATTASDNDTVVLGLPPYGGSRILINKSVSSTQSFTSTPTGATTPTTSTIQHGVRFAVSGRLNLFQANEIDGDAVNPPGQFVDTTANPTATRESGGTTLFAGTAGTPPFFPDSTFKGGVTGQIADVRIGGNATNFTTLVNDGTASGGDKISNFSIGGETDNVLLVAPTGSRNVVFGKGMDTVQIASHVIDTLKANRGALNSTVQVDRKISRIDFGGDVVNTKVLAGYQQNFNSILTTVIGSNPASPPAPIPPPIAAQPDGGMTVHVAGDVTNSVFAASTEPVKKVFGDPNELLVTAGHIKAKVEGKIDNAKATPSSPTQAFYAQHVELLSGPVVPPSVPEAPYVHNSGPTHLPGVPSIRLRPTAGIVQTSPKAAAAIHAQAATTTTTHVTAATKGHATAAPAVTHSQPAQKILGQATPKGHATAKVKKGY